MRNNFPDIGVQSKYQIGRIRDSDWVVMIDPLEFIRGGWGKFDVQ